MKLEKETETKVYYPHYGFMMTFITQKTMILKPWKMAFINNTNKKEKT
jgi:hypothetical protein